MDKFIVFKDLKLCGIDVENLESCAHDLEKWRLSVRNGLEKAKKMQHAHMVSMIVSCNLCTESTLTGTDQKFNNHGRDCHLRIILISQIVPKSVI